MQGNQRPKSEIEEMEDPIKRENHTHGANEWPTITIMKKEQPIQSRKINGQIVIYPPRVSPKSNDRHNQHKFEDLTNQFWS